MGRIDSEGTFLGTVEESGVNVTQKSSFPQWVARLKGIQKWIDDPEGMKHFGLTEPGFVDWSTFNEEINAFLVLFKSADEFSDATKLLNYEQLQLALDWDGASFDALGDGSMNGKVLMFRTANEEYDGKVSLKVSWIDSKNASATRSLKTLDSKDISALSAKLKMGIKKAPAAPSKPVASKPVASAAKPAATAVPSAVAKSGATPAPAAPVAATPPSASVPSTPASAPKPPKGKAKKAEAPAPESPVEEAALPQECEQGVAWDYVCAHKGDNEDQVVEEAWIDACAEVGGDKDEDKFTPEEWAKVRDATLSDLAAD
jgi:hypothetical protein